jgi:signal transduction histidine kinase
MSELIDDMLYLSKVTRVELNREPADLASIAQELIAELRARDPQRKVEFVSPRSLPELCDVRLMRIALANLLGNAWKFTGHRDVGRIELSMAKSPDGAAIYRVQDNGAGFDMAYAAKLFTPFERLHSDREFPGTGIGLATVQRIIERHDGRLWAESEVDRGSSFLFTLGRS